MIDISDRCVFSGSKDKLTLTMTININGEDWKVAISSEHEDTATPGAIKKLISGRLKELEDLKTKADLLGMMLVPKNSVVAAPAPAPVAQPKAPQQQAPPIQQQRTQNNNKSAEARNSKSQEARNDRQILEEMANSTTKHTIQQVTAPSGRTITVPKSEVSKAGTTEFKIVSTSNKELLNMVEHMNRDGNPTFGERYSVRDCGSCSGTGKKGEATCIACKGRGLLG